MAIPSKLPKTTMMGLKSLIYDLVGIDAKCRKRADAPVDLEFTLQV